MLNAKRRKKMRYVNENQKKNVGIAIHIFDKINFKPKIVTRDKESNYIMIK